MLALASIYMTMNKTQLCNQQCQAVFNVDPKNNDASLVLNYSNKKVLNLIIYSCLLT